MQKSTRLEKEGLTSGSLWSGYQGQANLKCTVDLLNLIPFKFPNLILDLDSTMEQYILPATGMARISKEIKYHEKSASIIHFQISHTSLLLLRPLQSPPLDEKNFGQKCQCKNALTCT